MILDPFSLDSYDYHLPSELIATYPISPKNSARLLVYERETKKITHTFFSEFTNFIPRDSLLIFNDTKVIKARLYGKKESGGSVELLYHEPILKPYKNSHKEQESATFAQPSSALQKDAQRFLVQIKGRVKKGHRILLERGFFAEICELLDDGFREVIFLNPQKIALKTEELLAFLESHGHIPLPPYIKRDDTQADSCDYQTPFAKHLGAIAAPTASLHFDESEASALRERFMCADVTLHVGAGTFLGVESDDIRAHKMHTERFFIPQESAKKIEKSARILAFGTTAARVVEHYARTKEREGECGLFLHHGNPPQKTTALLTNFHLPKSTLLMLVSSFVGVLEMQRIYAEAIEKKYRFYSYGDGMLIL